MIKGLYAAASAMLAGLSRQNALAHNVSNLDTPGFKQLMVTLDDFLNVPMLQPSNPLHPNGINLVGSLGLGVEAAPETIDFTQGPLKFSGQPLDFAIQGPGFFRIQTPNGERYTRDGRFLRDADGQLVTVDGYRVLDQAGQPIDLPEGDLVVLGDGTIYSGGALVAQMGLAAFTDPAEELTPDLPNTFAADGGPTGEDLGVVQQGFLEMSNANPADLMTQMVMVTRAYEAAQQMVQTQDELLGKTISSLGQI